MEIKYHLITKTIPEWNSKHRNLYTCSIGFSPELGLIRVYPIPLISDFNAGHVYHLEVEKRKMDTRARSYELVGAYDNRPRYKKIRPFDYGHLAPHLLQHVSPSISELNKRRDSIGILSAEDFRVYWEYSSRFVNHSQRGLFEDAEVPDFAKFTKESREKEARMIFNDADGMHDLQYNEWGVYEFGRKFGNRPEAFRYAEDASHILIGNMLQFQNVWMVLKALKLVQRNVIKNPAQLAIFE